MLLISLGGRTYPIWKGPFTLPKWTVSLSIIFLKRDEIVQVGKGEEEAIIARIIKITMTKLAERDCVVHMKFGIEVDHAILERFGELWYH